MKTFKYKNTSTVLEIDYDYEDDCTKAFHTLIDLETRKPLTTIPWSPYSNPTDSEVEAWLALGAPDGLVLKHSWGEQHINFCSETLKSILAGGKTIFNCEYSFIERAKLNA